MMKAVLWGALLAMMIPVASEAATARYDDYQGDWHIMGMGMSNGSGNSFSCGMMSKRETEHDFTYLVSVGPGRVEFDVSVDTSFSGGPVSATLAVKGGQAFPLTGNVNGKGLATLAIRDKKWNEISSAMYSEIPMKLTLNRPNAPPQVIDISMADASSGLYGVETCYIKMVGMND